MKNLIINSIKSVSDMTTKERNFLLCQLAAKEQMNVILPHEMLQLEFIQAIRRENGEIERVLKNWDENPECDPRNKNEKPFCLVFDIKRKCYGHLESPWLDKDLKDVGFEVRERFCTRQEAILAYEKENTKTA